MEAQEQVQEQVKVEAKTAPRHKGTVTIKKAKTFEEAQAQRVLEGVKTWSTRMLEAQAKSDKVPKEMKAAIEAELKLRKK